MRNAELSPYFLTEGEKTLSIKFSGDSNYYGLGNIVQESLRFDERLTIDTQTLRFGDFVVSEAEFEFVPNSAYATHDYVDEDVSIVMGIPGQSTTITLMSGYVIEDEITDNISNIRHIVCRDKMGKIIGEDATSWYNGLTLPMQLSALITSFRTWLAGKTGLAVDAPNTTNIGSIVVNKCVSGTLGVAEILSAIGECTASFPHVVGNTLKWISLATSGTAFTLSSYKSGKVGKKDTDKITQIYTRGSNGSVSNKYPSTDGANPYEISNFLTYGMSSANKTTLCTQIYSRVKDVAYRYVDIETIGNPCYEVGDRYTASINGQTITTYIIGRTLKGIHALMDAYDTPRETKNNSTNSVRAILQRQGAINVQFGETTSGLSASVTQEVADRNNAISSAIGTEVTNRNSAITSAIGTEVTNRNTAISNATSGKLDSVGGTQSFGWDLTSTAFKLKNNGTEVFRANASGVYVKGNGEFTGTVGANGIKTVDGTNSTEIKGGSMVNEGDYGIVEVGDGYVVVADGLDHATVRCDVIRLEHGYDEDTKTYFRADSDGIVASNLACGHATIGSQWGTGGTISFGKTFPSVPKVVASYSQSSWVSGQIGAIKIRNVTTTGFQASISGEWEGSVGIDWIAMC